MLKPPSTTQSQTVASPADSRPPSALVTEEVVDRYTQTDHHHEYQNMSPSDTHGHRTSRRSRDLATQRLLDEAYNEVVVPLNV